MRGSWKFYLILFGLALGVLFEAVKRMDVTVADDQVKLRQAMNRTNEEPYSRTLDHDHEAGATLKARYDQAMKDYKFPEVHSFDHKGPAKPRGTAVAATDKKAEDKKKKKKKKAADPYAQWTPFQPATLPPRPVRPDGASSSPVANLAATPTVPEQPAPKTINDWAEILLVQPDARLNSEFISEYLSGQITADVFYGVVELMLGDPRPEMRTQGVAALAATPSLTSFMDLAKFAQSEAYNTVAHTKTLAALSSYANPRYLHVLQAVISANSDPGAVLVATQDLNQIATLALQNAKNSPPNGSGGQPNGPGTVVETGGTGGTTQVGNGSGGSQPNGQPVKSKIAQQLNPFVNLLENLLKTTKDGEIQAVAHQALKTIQTVLEV